jgi:putative addiction module component (TIGR02574 family)
MTRAFILAEALRLPVEERAKLIAELIGSIEEEPAEGAAAVEQAWATELEERIARADALPEDAIDRIELRTKLRVY